MPDLMRQSFLRCDAEQRFKFPSKSRAGVVYEVVVRGFDASCTCDGFRYRNTCPHTREAMNEKACQWNNHWLSHGMDVATNKTTGEYCCPVCGGPVTTFSDLV